MEEVIKAYNIAKRLDTVHKPNLRFHEGDILYKATLAKDWQLIDSDHAAMETCKMIEKPKHGEPCNNCGQCCENMLCAIAQYLCGYELGKCPMLEQDGDKSVCGLVANPAKYVPNLCIAKTRDAVTDAAKILIGAEVGCDACLETEEENLGFSARIADLRYKWRRDGTLAKATGVFGIPLV